MDSKPGGAFSGPNRREPLNVSQMPSQQQQHQQQQHWFQEPTQSEYPSKNVSCWNEPAADVQSKKSHGRLAWGDPSYGVGKRSSKCEFESVASIICLLA